MGDRSRGRYAMPDDFSLYSMVARTRSYAYDVGLWDSSIIEGPFSVAPCLGLRFATFASLYVGRRTRAAAAAAAAERSAHTRASAGSANASVLPEPVVATAMQSTPV